MSPFWKLTTIASWIDLIIILIRPRKDPSIFLGSFSRRSARIRRLSCTSRRSCLAFRASPSNSQFSCRHVRLFGWGYSSQGDSAPRCFDELSDKMVDNPQARWHYNILRLKKHQQEGLRGRLCGSMLQRSVLGSIFACFEGHSSIWTRSHLNEIRRRRLLHFIRLNFALFSANARALQ